MKLIQIHIFSSMQLWFLWRTHTNVTEWFYMKCAGNLSHWCLEAEQCHMVVAAKLYFSGLPAVTSGYKWSGLDSCVGPHTKRWNKSFLLKALKNMMSGF